MSDKLRLGVLASGRGSNLQAIIDHCQDGRLAVEIVLVISDVAEAVALERAWQAGVRAVHISRANFADKEFFHRAILDKLQACQVELVALAGYMRLLGSELVQAYRGRIMNIHPSLIPSFCGRGMHGLKVHQAALDYGVKVSGCTVHFVEEAVDAGPIILQRAVPVLDEDTPETLAARILEQEHIAYPQAIQLFAEGRLKIEGRRVRILPAPAPASARTGGR